MKLRAFALGSEITIPLKPEASPFKERVVNVPHPAGITPPVNEKPKTVEPPAETVKSFASADPTHVMPL